MIDLLPKIAAAQIGLKETQGKNLGPDVRRYQKATDLPPGAWPWCAAFLDWLLLEWLSDKKAAEWLNLKRTSPEKWRPKTALAFGLLKWAKDRPNTVEILPDSAMPEPGCLVVFDFSHCGVVERCQNPLMMTTIEGNTDSAGGRDGDGVWRRVRPRHIARAFLKIHPSNV